MEVSRMRSRNRAIQSNEFQLDLFSFSPAARSPTTELPHLDQTAIVSKPVQVVVEPPAAVSPAVVEALSPLELPPPPDRVPSRKAPAAVQNVGHYHITDEDQVGDGSLKQKARANLQALEVLKLIETEGRPATDTEKRLLVRYVGWGGFPGVFDDRNTD